MSTLTPEERQRIYEEEKARMEAEGKKPPADKPSTNLDPKTGAFLSYLGLWVTGIVFLLLEQKNRFIRFHATQSIIVFGFLFIAYLLLKEIPFVGWFFSIIIGVLAFVFWIVLMVKSYRGENFKLPVAGELAERLTGHAENVSPKASTTTTEKEKPANIQSSNKEPIVPRERPDRGHSGRIASSAFAIAWSIALLVFFVFFHDYIAFYRLEKIGNASIWIREPILAADFNSWLPIIVTILVFSIAGHALLLAVDKYIVRETTLLVLDIFGIAAIMALIAIFPFDFNVVADSDLAAWLELGLKLTLGIIAFGIGIAVIVRLIKILVNIIKGTATY